MSFGNYILKFARDTEKSQTHLSFNKGKYNVPDNKYNEFYKKYFDAMRTDEELFLIEKVYNSKFKFFLDIDLPKERGMKLSDDDVLFIIKSFNESIMELFASSSENLVKNIVSKREDSYSPKYHINFYNLIVDSNVAKLICDKAIELIGKEHVLVKCIDTSVYRTGLRLLGSMKNEKGKEKSYYRIYDLQAEKHIELKGTTFEDFMKTVVRVTSDYNSTELKEQYKSVVSTYKTKRTIQVKAVQNNGIAEEVTQLLQYIKSTNECIQNYNMEVEKICATQNKMGMICYYISIKERHCPFKEREHQRQSSPLYIEISMTGIFVKCYDQDCLRRKFPEKGMELPKDFGVSYPQMFLSMSTKYWRADVNITDETKRLLEDSLSGSHYQIAKTAFSIYKERFRVDDVRNTTWYEFDGVRWKKSHLMNILISEELPKYYRGIKISDTTATNSDNLQEFLTNGDKMDANMRNELVDNIIKKLENVNFKNNVMNQTIYLYKTYDPEFYTQLDSNPYLIGFKNGTYDFKQNVFRKSVQSDYITFSTGYDFIEYDEELPQIKEIHEFLGKIITNARVRDYLLKVLGKSLVGIPDEKFYLWTGLSGANGKSTLVNFLEHTLGDYTTSVDVSLLTNRRGNSSNASPDIIRLRGKRIFTFQEPEHDDKLRTGILKQFTGGDTIIARELFKAPVTFKLQGTMVMCCNDLPAVSSIDGGTWRRIRVIEFKSRFCENPVKDNEFKIDPTIKYKIKEWRPYFMSILIHWYNKCMYEGLDEPDEVKKATTKYKVDNDKFNEFFDQCLEEAGTFETNKTIFSHFQNWWSSAYPASKIPDNRELRRAMKIRYGDEKERVINGVVHYGFNVKVNVNVDECIEDDDDY